MLSAYDGAKDLLDNRKDNLIEIIDHATALFFGGKINVSAAEELNLRNALLHMIKHNQEHALELQEIRNNHREFLDSQQRTSNIDIVASEYGMEVIRTKLREYSDFDIFIFGHFHAPRDTDGIHDSGSFVSSQRTYLNIDSDGRVYR